MTEPTNADLFVLIENQTDAFKLHAADDHAYQIKNDKRMELVATKEDIKAIVEGVMRDFFKSEGKRAYAGLLIIAGIVGALVVIGGGLKSLLAWVGFNYIK